MIRTSDFSFHQISQQICCEVSLWQMSSHEVQFIFFFISRMIPGRHQPLRCGSCRWCRGWKQNQSSFQREKTEILPWLWLLAVTQKDFEVVSCREEWKTVGGGKTKTKAATSRTCCFCSGVRGVFSLSTWTKETKFILSKNTIKTKAKSQATWNWDYSLERLRYICICLTLQPSYCGSLKSDGSIFQSGSEKQEIYTITAFASRCVR